MNHRTAAVGQERSDLASQPITMGSIPITRSNPQFHVDRYASVARVAGPRAEATKSSSAIRKRTYRFRCSNVDASVAVLDPALHFEIVEDSAYRVAGECGHLSGLGLAQVTG